MVTWFNEREYLRHLSLRNIIMLYSTLFNYTCLLAFLEANQVDDRLANIACIKQCRQQDFPPLLAESVRAGVVVFIRLWLACLQSLISEKLI